ncbi:MAG: helicase-associated domain-containing protein [Caldilineaceae bacterium]
MVNNKLVASGKDALEIPAFWSGALAEQIGACLRQWPQLQRDADFHAAAEKYGPYYEAGYRALLGKLPTVPADQWVEPADLLDELQNENMNFLFEQHEDVETARYERYSGYIGGSYYYGDRTEILQELVRLEALFVRCGIEHFLLPLGLVELGYAAEDDENWQAFRWTPLGQTVLNKASSAPPEVHQGAIVVQPNFHVLAMGPVQLNLLAQLDLFAERQRADVGAFEYRLTRESVYAAQQLGLDAATIRQTLVQMNGSELPQNVRRTLEEWSAHHERIVFHTRVDLLQAADDALLKKLLETAPSRAHIERGLAPTDAPTVALIKERGKKKLVAALLEAEILPAISSANPDAADASVVIDEAGAIQPIHAVPSLHLRGRLDRVAEESNGGWRVTAKSAQRAGGSQKKVSALLDELGKLHRGALPAPLIDQLKAWGGYYGTARAETLTLIEFQNQSILDELLAYPTLKDNLTRFAREGRALAIVENGKLAEVKKVLSELGVSVKKGIG